jgi:hypothetical protein
MLIVEIRVQSNSEARRNNIIYLPIVDNWVPEKTHGNLHINTAGFNIGETLWK